MPDGGLRAASCGAASPARRDPLPTGCKLHAVSTCSAWQRKLAPHGRVCKGLVSANRRLGSCPARLLFLKLKSAVAGLDLDLVAGLQFPVQQFHGERIQQQLLNGAFQRTRTELRIVTLLRQELLRRLVQFDPEILQRQPFLETLQLHVHNRGKLLVMMMMVFLKSTVRPWPSVRRPSSSTWSSTLNTSWWAFSISSNKTTQYG